MKRTVICLLLIASMALTGTLIYMRTDDVTDDVSAKLTELEVRPDPAAARALSGEWEDFCSRNIFLTNNECAFEISMALAHIASGSELGADIKDECRFTKALLSIYKKSCAPAPENVF